MRRLEGEGIVVEMAVVGCSTCKAEVDVVEECHRVSDRPDLRAQTAESSGGGKRSKGEVGGCRI